MLGASLRSYFENLGRAKAALQQYAVSVAHGRAWSLRESKRDLYRIAKKAFGSSLTEKTGRDVFNEIYNTLRRNWQVFRPLAASQHWNSDQVYSALRNMAGTSRHGSFSLKSDFRDDEVRQALKQHLQALRRIKPGNYYPAMPVAKFSHFFNPSLFPIYDTAVIYRKVLKGSFRKDWTSFDPELPRDFFTSDDGIWDAYSWIAWGSEMIRNCHPKMMDYFADWFINETRQQGDSVQDLEPDLKSYYGAAFEFVAIGACYLGK